VREVQELKSLECFVMRRRAGRERDREMHFTGHKPLVYLSCSPWGELRLESSNDKN
jgi:hypothetical protein